MIVCDMCPDRTPATMRWTVETIDSELPKVESDHLFLGMAEALGLMPKANLHATVAVCQEHSTLMSQDPEIGRQMFQDAVIANRRNEPPDA